MAKVYDEVVENQMMMTSLLGASPRFFRSGTAHFDEVAAQIVRAVGLVPVNFDVNADAGGTFSAPQVRRATAAAMQGSICIAHFNRPETGTAPGMRGGIADLLGSGAKFATLGQVLV